MRRKQRAQRSGHIDAPTVFRTGHELTRRDIAVTRRVVSSRLAKCLVAFWVVAVLTLAGVTIALLGPAQEEPKSGRTTLGEIRSYPRGAG